MQELIRQVQEACAKACDGFGNKGSAAVDCAAAIRALDLSHLSGWQPIETAPKDFVTEFDGWNGDRVLNVCWEHPYGAPKGENDWCVSEYDFGLGWRAVRVKNLTHWMPLPAPPKPSE